MKISSKLKLMKVVIFLCSCFFLDGKTTVRILFMSLQWLSQSLSPNSPSLAQAATTPLQKGLAFSLWVIHISETHPLKGDRNCLTRLPNLAWAMTNACAVPWNTGRKGAIEMQSGFQEQKYIVSHSPPPFILSHVFVVVPVYFVNRV